MYVYRLLQVVAMAHKKAYDSHVEILIKCLPMDDALFITKLSSHNLLPGDNPSKIKSLSTPAEKASYFLTHVIQPSLDIDDISDFDNLLSVMEDCGYNYVKKLSCKIKSEIYKPADIKSGISGTFV